MKDPGFFVGYLPNPPVALARLNLACGLALLGLFLALAFALGRGADVAAAGLAFGGEESVIEGVMERLPYPYVRMAQGHGVLLAGDGKNGVQAAAAELAGKSVRVTGYMLKRGAMDLLIVDKVAATPGRSAGETPVALGRWRASGEICDGKCAAGVMHPGSGLAHRACANLCIAGGLPPVLVMAAPLEGAEYLLLAAADGGPAPALAADWTALPVELEGDVERRGDILVMKVEWSQARRL